MNEQIIILLLSISILAVTLFLYIWRAYKQVQYKNDERWQHVLLKSKTVADFSNWILITVIAILIANPATNELTFSVNRILLFGLSYFGLHNLFELIGLIYYNHSL